jgi:hypothetical protein
LNPFNKRFVNEEMGDRNITLGTIQASSKFLNFHLKVADRYVNLLCELPKYRDLSTEELFKLLTAGRHSKGIAKFVPLVGDDLEIREAAYEREERQRRAVIIGMLAKPEEIEQHYGQKFLESL